MDSAIKPYNGTIITIDILSLFIMLRNFIG